MGCLSTSATELVSLTKKKEKKKKKEFYFHFYVDVVVIGWKNESWCGLGWQGPVEVSQARPLHRQAPLEPTTQH